MGVGQAASIPADAAMGRGWMLGQCFAGKNLWHVPPSAMHTRAMVLRAAARPPAPTSIDIPPRRTTMDESHFHRQRAAVMAQAWYVVSQRYGFNVPDAAAIRYRYVRGWRRAHRLARRWAAEITDELGFPTDVAAVYWTHIDRV